MDIKQLQKINEQYVGVASKYDIFNQEFVDEILPILILAPNTDKELSHAGGLLKHTLLLSSKLFKLNELLPQPYDTKLVVVLSFLNNIGRYDLYTKDSNGKYVFSNNDVTLKPNHKSIHLINKYNLLNSFNDSDKMIITQAILNSTEYNLDTQYRYFSEPLTHILRMAMKLTEIELQYANH